MHRERERGILRQIEAEDATNTGSIRGSDNVEVARSGDLAYETGSYSLTMSDPEGNAATQSGHYVVVWKKDAAGAWKVAVDVPASDPPV